jgi:uncharacterized LabA/DUF88 family protein
MRAVLYVDGFNLYYRCLKGTPYRWLDLERLAATLMPRDKVVGLRYFTAHVRPSPAGPRVDYEQKTYLRALRTLPCLEVEYGRFVTHAVSMPAADAPGGLPLTVRVLKTEEKGSDVNLAVRMVCEGYEDLYDLAAVVSNDSDLIAAVRAARGRLGKTVGVFGPPHRASRELLREADFYRPLTPDILQRCQFPAVLADARGEFRKPAGW